MSDDAFLTCAFVVVAVFGCVLLWWVTDFDMEECMMRLTVAQAESVGMVTPKMVEQSFVACNEIEALK